jgi:hypothetical protein
VPPIPPGLDSLTASLRELAEQFGVDSDALAVAAGLSGKLKTERIPMDAVLDQLPADAMKALLGRVADGEGIRVGVELNRLACLPPQTVETPPLQCSEFAAQVIGYHEARLAGEARVADEKRRRADAERKRQLELVMERADSVWNELDPLMDKKVVSAYDVVAKQLEELRDAYRLHKRDSEFREKLAAFKKCYARRPAMMHRIEELDARDER